MDITQASGPAGTPPPVAIVVPRQAATVAVVRDGRDGLEVLLLQRTSRASFVAGAHVFPGGAVDDVDVHADPLLTHVPAATPPGFTVAAIRECFEEAGLLYAHHHHGGLPSEAARAAWRAELHDGAVTFGELLTREGLRLDSATFGTWSRWVTPVGSPKRFDTRFLVAVAPPDQEATPDTTEITACRWYRPEEALGLAAAGEMLLITPTRSTLTGLAAFRTTREVLAAVGGR